MRGQGMLGVEKWEEMKAREVEGWEGRLGN